MSRVKVWNDNVHPHTEVFKGDKMHIPAGEFIEMDYHDAKDFLSQFTAIKKRGDGTDCPTGFKNLRIDGEAPPATVESLVCHANGERAATQEDLERLFIKFGGSRATEDPNASKGNDPGLKSEVEELKAQVAALLAANQKSKGGRPRKEAQG